MKKDVLKNFAIPQEPPVLEFLFNKVARLKACNFIKKRPQHMCFPFLLNQHMKIANPWYGIAWYAVSFDLAKVELYKQ